MSGESGPEKKRPARRRSPLTRGQSGAVKRSTTGEMPTIAVASSLERPAAAAAMPRFCEGDVVGKRYRIRSYLGEGGMGEVYEADDLVIEERVALKALRPELASDEGAVARLKREVQLARRVTHANVCRLFDVGFHAQATRRAGGRGRASVEVAFLTMELLPGQTLAARIRRGGALRAEEALPLIRQMGAGLAAAHDAGVIHRDFKSSNVMLVGAPRGAVRAVVTDFGLARSVLAAPDGTRATGTGVVGSPAYMAPEQVEGSAVTALADLYALGVVLYEMTTGTLPFVADTPLATAVKRLRERPLRPRAMVPDLDPRWEDVILRCLEREPARRFASAREVAEALDDPERAEREQGSDGSGRTPFAPWPSAAPARPARPTVAVLGFKNVSGRPGAAWISTALAEMLATELQVGDGVRTIPGEAVARTKQELAIAEAESYAPATLASLRRCLGVDAVVMGSYLAVGKEGEAKVRLDLKVQDTLSGEVTWAASDAGSEADIIELIARTGRKLCERLGAGREGAAGESVARPRSAEAARLYAEGIAHLRAFEVQEARTALERAAIADPGYAQTHAALCDCYEKLGFQGRARESACCANELAVTLPREERMHIEARYHAAMGDWSRAAALHGALFDFFPGDLEYGIAFAEAQCEAGRAAESLETVGRLRALPPPAGDDPRLDLVAARSLAFLSRYLDAERLSRNAASKGLERGARLVVAQARSTQSWALRFQGRIDESMTAAREALDLYRQAGHKSGIADALNVIAGLHVDRGRYGEALQARREALALHRETGNRRGEATQLANTSWIELALGRLDEAERLARDAAAIQKDVGDRRGIPWSRMAEAAALTERGDLPRARTILEEALRELQSLEDRRGQAWTLHRLATLDVHEGDLVDARRKLEKAQELRDQHGHATGVAHGRLALARIDLEEGDAATALRHARDAQAQFTREGARDYEALALLLEALARHAGGDDDGARTLVVRARTLAEGSEMARLAFALPQAEALLDPDDAHAAEHLARLDALRARAESAGCAVEAAETRLLHATLLARSAPGEAIRELHALAAEARSRGLAHVARRAAPRDAGGAR